MKNIRIYCKSYRPFILGGNVHAMLTTTVEAQGPFNLGKGFKGFVVTAPTGNTYVVEETSGGVVGDTINAVKKDIAACSDKKIMMQQILDCARESKGATTVSREEFWNGFPTNPNE